MERYLTDIIKTLDQILPEVHLSLDFGIMFHSISLLTPFFPPVTLTPSHFLVSQGLGHQGTARSLRLPSPKSEKCYSQELVLRFSWFYRNLDSIPGS